MNKVRIYLIITLLAMILVPFGASYLILNDVVHSQQNIYNNETLRSSLVKSQESLKKLSLLDPENSEKYKSQFNSIQELKLIFEDETFFSEKLQSTMSKYFVFVFLVCLILPLIFSFILSYKIDRHYRFAYTNWKEQEKKSAYLEEVNRWQEIAKKLAHEIKRPLQPIKTWMYNLNRSYTSSNSEQFSSHLAEAYSTINQEVDNLDKLVQGFSKFSQFPDAKMEPADFPAYLQKFVSSYRGIWPRCSLRFNNFAKSQITVDIDEQLFRLVLTNLIQNAIEANPNADIQLQMDLSKEQNSIHLRVYNSGKEIPKGLFDKIFELHYSTKDSKENMGMGLPIVKYLLLQQNANISCVPTNGGACFLIQFNDQRKS